MATLTFSPGRLTTSQPPLQTPFWFSGAATQASCSAVIIDPAETSTTFCCNGLLIDITQPILGPLLSSQRRLFYFDNLRCCSGDPDAALGSVTTCTTGSAAMLATSVAEVTSSMSNSSGIQFGIASTSTSTVLSTSDITTTVMAASSSTSTSGGRTPPTVGITIYIFTILSMILALRP